MDSLMLRYFREEANVNVVNITVSAILPNLALPANRLRYGIILPQSLTTRIIFHFGEQWNSNRIGWFNTTGFGFGCITEDVFGEAIRLPLFVWADAGVTTEITEIAYDPRRYDQMMRYVNANLSKYGAS